MKGLTAHSIPLKDWIADLQRGRYQIPDFQREFEWDPQKIDDLMRSIFRDYYIGSLLLWEGGNYFDALSCEPISGYEGGQNARTHIVLDGQQRLSAIYYALFSPDKPAPKKKYRSFHFIHIDRLMDGDYEGAFKHQSQRIPYETPQDQYKNHCFPLSILGQGHKVTDDWLNGYQEQHRDYGKKFRSTILDVIDNYKISYINLGGDIGIAKVCDIFTKINSTGIKLDIFDLLNALLKPEGVLLKQQWKKAKQQDFDSVDFPKLNIDVLRVMSILLQNGSCSPKYLYNLVPDQGDLVQNKDREIYIHNADEFMLRWDDSIDAIKKALGLLSREYGAIVPKFTPYPAILPVFSALNVTADNQPDNNKFDAFSKVKRWYWASIFTERYGRSVATTTSSDYKEVCAWMEGGPVPDVINNFPQSVEEIKLHGQTRQNAAIYKGVINLIILNGANDWYKGLELDPETINDHHIVPKSWGKNLGTNKGDINTILNRTPLSKDTNQKIIRDRLPNEYLPELMAENDADDIRAIFKSHLISSEAFDILLKDPFEPDHFYEFIAARQRTILSAIKDLFDKNRADLDPDLREMDEAIENIEIALRGSISEVLDQSFEDIKGLHFFPKMNDRIANELRRDPSLDRDYYATLDGKLEYFDLRELEDTITNKRLWNRFVARYRFGSKEELSQRFRRLAELRNAIRHARPASAITRKDGEAAILWFRDALKKKD